MRNYHKIITKKDYGAMYMEYRKYGEWLGRSKYAKKLLARKARREMKKEADS